MARHASWWVLALVFALLACGEASDAGDMRGPGDPGDGLGGCGTDGDCPAGLICSASVCVADDGLPPEEEEPAEATRPAASARRLWVLAPSSDALTLIDTADLSLGSVPMPSEPIDVAVLPGEEAALVLSGAGRALSVVEVDEAGVALLEVRDTGRRFDALALSPDGSTAVLWTPDGLLPSDGAEGLLGVVDVAALRAGATDAITTLAAGRRHQAIFFHLGAGAAEAVIVAKGELVVVTPGEDAPVRVPLPDAFAEPATREAIATPDGSLVLLRSLGAAELAVFDVEARALSPLPLPAAATDLDVSEDGSLALAVLRSTSQVALLPLPDALEDPGAVELITVELPGTSCEEPGCTHAPGQAALAADGSFALLFSNAAPTEAIARLSTADGEITLFDRLEKWVQTVAIAPERQAAVILHRAHPGSTAADLYEREVDRAEGHTVLDLESGAAQLKLTGDRVPRGVVFPPGGRFASVPLRNQKGDAFGLDAIDLETLVVQPLPLASTPEFAGPLPAPTEDLAHRMWVTQAHPAGRIGIVRLDEMTVRTITGFELGGEVR